ncbi:MAG: FAD-dependent oxidoreductase, partial [Amphiplicatus sp.]
MLTDAQFDAEVIIVGGGYAGMTAALQLARARRKTLVVDAAVRRNRFAGAAHGFLGHDGAAPDQLWAAACDQLLAYPAAAYVEGEATQAEQSAEGIEVALSSGERLRAKKLIVASGVEDI